jgi:CheY-like chemotaxis protein
MADSAAARRVLVIDDEPLIRSFTTRALRAAGFAVAEAAGGREGLRIALSDSPDVVLLDLGLPDLEGAEVLRRLRDERPDQAVLVWSAADLLRSIGAAGRARPTANGASMAPASRTCGRGPRRGGPAKS